MTIKLITIIGGSGFLGRSLAKKFVDSNFAVRVISRFDHNERNGKVEYIKSDIRDIDSSMIRTSHAIINLVGILFEKEKNQFNILQAEEPARLAQLAKAANISQFIHVSALGCDKVLTSQYAISKFAGEHNVLKHFADACIIRPSIIFGPEDDFFNRFAKMAKFSPFLPLIHNGATKFQPVYVEDVAHGIFEVMRLNQQGKIFEFAGPSIYNFKFLLEYILKLTHKSRILLPLPTNMCLVLADICKIIRMPLITKDQIELLKYDNIINDTLCLSFKDLGITPHSIEEIVPQYL
jgi:NADH dehydrogenase